MSNPRNFKHKDIMLQWLSDDSLIIEVNGYDDGWIETKNPEWNALREYRLKVKYITIGGVKVPEPIKTPPEDGTRYYVPDPITDSGVESYVWVSDGSDLILMNRGMCHLTQENAIIHAMALYKFTAQETL